MFEIVGIALAVLLLVLSVFDALSTIQAFKKGAREANPVMAAIQKWAPKLWPFIRFGFSLVVVGLAYWAYRIGAPQGAIIVLFAGCALVGYAVKNNYDIAWGKE